MNDGPVADPRLARAQAWAAAMRAGFRTIILGTSSPEGEPEASVTAAVLDPRQVEHLVDRAEEPAAAVQDVVDHEHLDVGDRTTARRRDGLGVVVVGVTAFGLHDVPRPRAHLLLELPR